MTEDANREVEELLRWIELGAFSPVMKGLVRSSMAAEATFSGVPKRCSGIRLSRLLRSASSVIAA